MSSLCVIDQVPATEGDLCSQCSRQFQDLLRRAPELVAELETTTARQAKQTRGVGAASSGGRPLVFNVGASEVRGELVRALRAVSWLASSPLVFRFEDPPAVLVGRALGSWDRVVRSPEVVARWAQLDAAVKAAVRAVDVVPERRVIGECDCGAVLSTDGEREEVRCRSCGVLWEVADLEGMRARRVESHLERFVSAEEMSSLFGVLGARVPAATVRKWVQRGRLPVVVGPAGWNGIWAPWAVAVWEQSHGRLVGGVAA